MPVVPVAEARQDGDGDNGDEVERAGDSIGEPKDNDHKGCCQLPGMRECAHEIGKGEERSGRETVAQRQT